jgi:hypothetical protein
MREEGSCTLVSMNRTLRRRSRDPGSAGASRWRPHDAHSASTGTVATWQQFSTLELISWGRSSSCVLGLAHEVASNEHSSLAHRAQS